jgi:hypothetical protein
MILRISFIVVAAFAFQALAQQPQGEASLDAARADAARGDHRAALQKIARLLSTSAAPPAAERYALLMLRGESLLQLKDRAGAISAYKAAAKSAADLPQFAAARANALIIEVSANGMYAPAGESAIDVLDPTSRKRAMARLQAELLAKNKREIENAMRAETLPPLERVFVPVAHAFLLEAAATGEGKETLPTMRELGSRAYRLMHDEVKRYARHFDQLNQLAASATDYAGGWGVTSRGLLPDERNQLRDDIDYLSKVQARAREYRDVSAKLGGDEQKWDALLADVTDVLFEGKALSGQQEPK